MHNPLVTTIALCYNQEKYCIETLESIRKQTYSNIQLIITDDASTDNSVEVIEDWIAKNPDQNIEFIKHESNKGICATLNEALSRVKGSYIQMIACDDIMLPEKTERQVNIMELASDKIGFVYSDAHLIKDNGQMRYGLFIQKHRDFEDLPSGKIYTEVLKDNFIPAMSTLIRKNVFDQVGYYDEKLMFEDYDMWLRITKEFDVIVDNFVSVKYRIHSSNTHSLLKKWFESYLTLHLKHTENPIAVSKINLKLIELSEENREFVLQFMREHPDLIYNEKLKLSLLSESEKVSRTFKISTLINALFLKLKRSLFG